MAAIVGKDYRMEVWQNGQRKDNFRDVFYSGQGFTVTWVYTPTQEEREAGAKNRQYQSEDFAPKTSFIRVVGEMKALRVASLVYGLFIDTPTLIGLLGG